MCRRITCSSCGKPTFAGCGAHVEQVLGNVPPAERCRCAEDAKASASSSGQGTPADGAPRRGSWWPFGGQR